MQHTLHLLIQTFHEAIIAAFPQLLDSAINVPIEVVQSTNEKFGHYQCNSAMKLAGPLKLAPRAIADKIVQHVQTKGSDGSIFIAKLEIAGPGFINITIDSQFIADQVKSTLHSTHLGIESPHKKQRIVIDFSSPNVAKEMHVGHLRSTIIGDCLARLFEFLGHDVLRLNHIGDWGTAFGMLITYMKQEVPEVFEGKKTTDLTHLMMWYKASKQKFDTDPDFKRASQLEVVSLQKGDADALSAWRMICDVSEKAYQEIYRLLDVKIENRGESFYNPMLADVVADLESKGLVQISNGAKCIFLDGFQNREGETLPLMVQKSDGGYNYDTTDMAAMRQRTQEEKADRIIIVTDAGQATHFQMVFKAAERAGYLNPEKSTAEHVPFGLVLGADGKKFRTRSGETEKLIDLLTTAIVQARSILSERSPDMNEEQRELLAHALGIGAVKYADLSCHRTSDYAFSYERMLRFEGNTAAFLMYAYVRVASIKRKVNVDLNSILDAAKIELTHNSEIALAMHIIQFEEALEQVSKELLPNRLTDYLYQLAEKFNAFFRDCRVEGTPEQNSRLLLCEATARTLHQGLEILGLKTVDKM